ncbi:MAG: L-seryl-tRNA(Sec) selenium transferase [Acidobacteriota bacterium]|jgi:L-seryl-tRNA(Ser) seleniumtransferase|nr:L-seryl-tRNA(Sec) selenium transferase [Acidobacteriota bacterium]
MSEPATAKTSALRSLPSVDQLLRTETAVSLRKLVGLSQLTALARIVTDEMRAKIQASEMSNGDTRETLLLQAEQRLKEVGAQESKTGIRRVINATGVILHTNLGRAPLSQAARAAVAGAAAGYCTLEYDAVSGSRGRRGARVEELLIELTGAEDALVVNNCAAAALLILSVLAGDGETLVSRGELVEIGGDFRVPDVMSNSGTQMIEVGTTNRTHLDDYRRAITEGTRLIMRVHPSNYRIVGFTTSPSLSELAQLAHDQKLGLFEDAGSGVLTDLGPYELGNEPVISDCISEGADVVSFSGDKLLGSTQAGLIVGRREIVNGLRRHSLYRALRVDKLTLAALEATLESHRRGTALQDVPALHMLSLRREEIELRAKNLTESLSQRSPNSGLIIAIREGKSAVGGGSGPATHPATVLISLQHASLSAEEIQRRLRLSSPPVIARIAGGRVLIDLRTVAPEEEPELIDAISHLIGESLTPTP